MLYDIQDLDVIKAQGRKTSDHVRVMAIGLIKDCIKEKMEILTSQGAINHALDFIDKTHNHIKEEFNNKDMEQVIEQDKDQSDAINDAIERNNLEEEIQSYDTTAINNKSSFSTTTTTTLTSPPEELEKNTDVEEEKEEE